MPKSVQYRTKIVDVSMVEFEGVAEYRPYQDDLDLWAWHVGSDNLEEWLEKFDGQRVRLRIETFGVDESHLLPETAPPSGEASE